METARSPFSVCARRLSGCLGVPSCPSEPVTVSVSASVSVFLHVLIVTRDRFEHGARACRAAVWTELQLVAWMPDVNTHRQTDTRTRARTKLRTLPPVPGPLSGVHGLKAPQAGRRGDWRRNESRLEARRCRRGVLRLLLAR